MTSKERIPCSSLPPHSLFYSLISPLPPAPLNSPSSLFFFSVSFVTPLSSFNSLSPHPLTQPHSIPLPLIRHHPHWYVNSKGERRKDHALLFAHSCSSCQPQHHLILCFVLLLCIPSFCPWTKNQKKQHNKTKRKETPKLRLHESQGNELLLPSFLSSSPTCPLFTTCHSWQKRFLFTLFFHFIFLRIVRIVRLWKVKNEKGGNLTRSVGNECGSRQGCKKRR